MANDDFTNTDSTPLTSHTVQNNWSCTYNTAGAVAAVILNNHCAAGSYAALEAYATESEESSSQVTVLANTASRYCGPAVRMPADNTGYYCYLTTHSGGYYTEVRIGKNASYKTAKACSADETVSHTLKITAVADGANVKVEVFLDGASLGTYTDSTSPLTSGNSGLVMSNGSSSSVYEMIDEWNDGAGESASWLFSVNMHL